MNKLVYLHELDSVRTSKRQILMGQWALFEEIVHNGNQVVLSFNQLTDSRAFLVALEHDETFAQLQFLLQSGAIKVARFYKLVKNETEEKQVLIRTAAEYMIMVLGKRHDPDDNDKFICSALPILNKNWALREIVKDAISYSDPARIQNLVEEKEADVINENLLIAHGIVETSPEDLRFIVKYVEMILAVSQDQHMYADAKPIVENESGLEVKKTFMDYMEILWEDSQYGLEDGAEKEARRSAACLLEEIYKSIPSGKVNNRSNWLEKWLQLYNSQIIDASSKDEKMVFCYAEMAINLCYNYTVEDGILGVSKHYKDREDFLQDFNKRINQLMADYCRGIYRLYSPVAEKENVENHDLPQWGVSARMVRISNPHIPTKYNGGLYEKAYKREKKKWRLQRVWRFLHNAIKNGWYIVYFVIASWLAGAFEAVVTNQLFAGEEFNPVVEIVVTAILFGIISTLSERVLQKRFSKLVIPDVTESIESLWYEIKDILYIKFNSHRNVSYVDQELICQLEEE